MDFERRSRYQDYNGSNDSKSEVKFTTGTIDPYILDLMCKFIMTDSVLVRRSALVNLRNLIYSVDPDSYLNDNTRKEKISFIKKGIEARLDYGLSDPHQIKMHIDGGIITDSIVDLETFIGLNSSEVNWLNQMVSESLQYAEVFKQADRLMEVCGKLKSAEFGSKHEAVKEFERTTSSIQTMFRKTRSESLDEAIFSLRDGVFQNSIYDIYRDLNSPRNMLKTGMQGLNQLLGGGFQAGRVYVVFGLPGEGKSALLLNVAYQIKKYNRFYKPKDPTKRPCVVMLTMENKVDESVNRLFDIATSMGSLKDYYPDDSIRALKEDGELYLSDDSPIDIIIKYKATNSVDTSYLYSLTEDLEDEGYEVICMIQDYIGRIRSSNKTSDLRLEYGYVVDEMKTYAANKDIPVITASQLNRDASKHIDEGRKSNKSDLVRLIGRSNVSESILILNNCDGGFVLAPEWTTDGKKYLGVQRIKKRFTVTYNRDYVYLPFKSNNEISLEEDENLAQPLFRESLIETNMDRSAHNPYQTNRIIELGQVVNNDSNPNIFKQSNVTDLNSLVAFRTTFTKPLIQPLQFFDDNGSKLIQPLEFFD